MNGTVSYLIGLATGAVGVWFMAWPYRKRYGLDYEFDRPTKIVRWSIVLACFGLALLPGPSFKVARIVSGGVLLGFVAWPNFAYHSTRLFKHDAEPRS
jgi:hypothetical protein